MPFLVAVNSNEPPASFVVLSYAIGAVLSYFVYNNVRRQRERAAAGDHVVETGRDVAVPDHCVRCGSPHASLRLEFPPLVIGVPPMITAFDRRFRKRYAFRFCMSCARPIRRTRKLAAGTIVLGSLLIATLPIFVFLANAIRNERGSASMSILYAMTACLFGGLTAILVGMVVRARAGSETVSILDTGASTVLFRFRNQVYRNHFAELNGER